MNEIIQGIGPKNTTEKIWKITGIGGLEGDHSLTISILKKYIVSFWIYKQELISLDPCTLNFGISGSVLNNETGYSLVNPNFFDSESWALGGNLNSYIGEWLLCIGYVFPNTTANTATTYSGLYDLSGNKIISGIDYRWSTDPSPWGGERIIQDNSSNEVILISRPSIYEFDEIRGPFLERMLGI